MAFLAESGDHKYFFMSDFIGGNPGLKLWDYITPDALGTILATAYIDDLAVIRVISVGDFIRVFRVTDRNDLSTQIATYRLKVIDKTATLVTIEVEGNAGNGTAFLEDFGSSVGLGSITRDTEAFQAAMVEGITIHGRDDTPFYYIGEGVTITGAGSYLKNARIKLALGPNGFSSVDPSAPTRYDPQHCLLNWDHALGGGGYENLEIYGDQIYGGGSGDYVCCPIAVNGGMTTKPFVGLGRLFIHDIPLVTAGVALNGVGIESCDIDTIEIRNFGTSQPTSYWVGVAAAFMQVTGVWIDDNSTSKRGRIRQIIGYEGRITGAAYVEGGQQSDLLTIAGFDTLNDKGPQIDLVDGQFIGEIVDNFGRGADINRIIGRDVELFVAKCIHGARDNRYGRVYGERVGLSIVVMAGSAGAVGDTERNVIESVTGYDHGNYAFISGVAGAATATTLVLPVGASSINDYYNSLRLLIQTGAHVQEVNITDYVGSTRTATVAAWTNGTPSDTPTVKVLRSNDRVPILFIDNGGVGVPKSNTVNVDGIHNGGDMTYLVKSNVTTSSANNRVTVNRDMGFSTAMCDVSVFGSVRVMPGSANRSVTRLGITSTQTISDTSAHVLNFDVVREDSYTRPAGGINQQASTAEKGIRVACSGPKMHTIGLRGQGGVAGMEILVDLYRGSSLMHSESYITKGTAAQNFTISYPLYHNETWFGSDLNLYTVQVTQSDAGAWAYSTVSFYAVTDA